MKQIWSVDETSVYGGSGFIAQFPYLFVSSKGSNILFTIQPDGSHEKTKINLAHPVFDMNIDAETDRLGLITYDVSGKKVAHVYALDKKKGVILNSLQTIPNASSISFAGNYCVVIDHFANLSAFIPGQPRKVQAQNVKSCATFATGLSHLIAYTTDSTLRVAILGEKGEFKNHLPDIDISLYYKADSSTVYLNSDFVALIYGGKAVVVFSHETGDVFWKFENKESSIYSIALCNSVVGLITQPGNIGLFNIESKSTQPYFNESTYVMQGFVAGFDEYIFTHIGNTFKAYLLDGSANGSNGSNGSNGPSSSQSNGSKGKEEADSSSSASSAIVPSTNNAKGVMKPSWKKVLSKEIPDSDGDLGSLSVDDPLIFTTFGDDNGGADIGQFLFDLKSQKKVKFFADLKHQLEQK